jgi:hypothetical protein
VDAIERQNYVAASIQATLYNAHFDCKGVPWTAEDLLGKGDRQKRISEALQSKIATSSIVQSAQGDDIPEVFAEVVRNSKGIYQ